MSIARLSRALRTRIDDERGVALPTVMIFMLAGVLLSLVVSSTVLYAYSFSSGTRANVQAQASAEAGIAAARAALLNGDCAASNGLFTSATAPEYSVQVYRPSGSGWTAGCPAVSEQARIVSTGTAATKGVGGASADDSTKVEAILGSIGAGTSLTATGPAIYAYDASGFSGSGTILSLDGTTPDVMLRTGNVSCTGASNGAVQLVVKSGTFTGSGSCYVAGNVWVNGDVNLSGGARVAGSITGRNVTIAANGPFGNVWADEKFTGNWSTPINGWVSAKTLEVAGATISGDAWARDAATTSVVSGAGVNGTLYTAGPLNLTGGSIKNAQIAGQFCRTGGSVASGSTVRVGSWPTSGCGKPITGVSEGGVVLAASPSKPAPIVVPEWIDFGSKPEHYTSAGWPGFVVYTMGTTCKEAQFLAALQAIGTSPGVIDARTCPNGIETFNGSATTYYEDSPQSGHHAWRVRNDLVIIANKFPLGNGSLNGVAGTHDVWFVNPDPIANGTPDCVGGTANNMTVAGGVKFTNVNVMIYNPCRVNISSGVKMQGQLFANNVSVDGAAQITYTPVGLPGYDLSTGLELGVPPTEWDRPIVSQRNITG